MRSPNQNRFPPDQLSNYINQKLEQKKEIDYDIQQAEQADTTHDSFL